MMMMMKAQNQTQTLTRMSSNSVPWSTFRNSTSHVQMSSVRFSLFSSSSAGGGSSLWYVHHWITFLRIAALTLGSGTGSSSPSSIPRSTHTVTFRYALITTMTWLRLNCCLTRTRLRYYHLTTYVVIIIIIITLKLCSPTLTAKTVTSELVWIICSNV